MNSRKAALRKAVLASLAGSAWEHRFELRKGELVRTLFDIVQTLEIIPVGQANEPCLHYRIYAGLYCDSLLDQVAIGHHGDPSRPSIFHGQASDVAGHDPDAILRQPFAICDDQEVPASTAESARVLEKWLIPFLNSVQSIKEIIEWLKVGPLRFHGSTMIYRRALNGQGPKLNWQLDLDAYLSASGLRTDLFQYGVLIESERSHIEDLVNC